MRWTSRKTCAAGLGRKKARRRGGPPYATNSAARLPQNTPRGSHASPSPSPYATTGLGHPQRSFGPPSATKRPANTLLRQTTAYQDGPTIRGPYPSVASGTSTESPPRPVVTHTWPPSSPRPPITSCSTPRLAAVAGRAPPAQPCRWSRRQGRRATTPL